MNINAARGTLLAVSFIGAALFIGYYMPPSVRTLKPGQVAPPLDKEIVGTFDRVPMRHDGRLKSFLNFSNYVLLGTRGMTSMTAQVEGSGKRKWSSTEWLLDVMFFPDKAADYPIFLIEDQEVLSELGLSASEEHKRRDRWSYNEMAPIRDRLSAEYESLGRMVRSEKLKIEDFDRSQSIIYRLGGLVWQYQALADSLKFAREGIEIPENYPEEPLAAQSGKRIPCSAALDLLYQTPEWKNQQQPEELRQARSPQLSKLLGTFQKVLGPASMIAWHAPFGDTVDKWQPSAGLMVAHLSGTDQTGASLELLRQTEALAAQAAACAQSGNKDEIAAFNKALGTFGESLISAAQKYEKSHDVPTELRYSRVPQEVAYHKYSLFDNAKWIFLLAFIILALSWINPGSRWSRVCGTIAFVMAAVACVALVGGITWRSVIMKRGPVATLYDTIPFITGGAVLLALLMEFVYRNRVSLLVACLLGVAGLSVAGLHEAKEAADTMPELQAVLRSNFWLMTHVTTINLGYATVFLGSVFSTVYIFCRLFDLPRRDKKLFKMLTQSAYGALCFGMFFSLVGTILGGIWGNVSWGRFWGWDPKENGALLICLWCLAILHMRLAGWIREIGLHVMSVLGAICVFFSWWGVNLLNVGLHTYGFTQGLERKLFISYGIIALIAVLGMVIGILVKNLPTASPDQPLSKNKRAKEKAPPPASQPEAA